MHRITHLLMSSLLHNKKMNEAMFCKKLSELERETERPSNAFQILGRDLDEADYHSDNVVCVLGHMAVPSCLHTCSLATLLAIYGYGPLGRT